MAGKEITIKTAGGSFAGYLASPASGRGPGIVVIQEIFGINAVMRAIADDLSARGYFALAPDLFWRLEPGVQLTDKTDEDWKRAFDLMGRFDPDAGTGDIQASIDCLRALPGATSKVGAVGYCLGGLLAYLTATRTDADASVGYYGVSIQDKLGEAANIKKPLIAAHRRQGRVHAAAGAAEDRGGPQSQSARHRPCLSADGSRLRARRRRSLRQGVRRSCQWPQRDVLPPASKLNVRLGERLGIVAIAGRRVFRRRHCA